MVCKFGIKAGETSVWALGVGERGMAIEDALGRNLPRGFPTVDTFENGAATSIKSVDLGTSGYQSGKQLSGTLNRYLSELYNFEGADWGGRLIDGSDILGRELTIAVPPGTMTPWQQSVFDRLILRGQMNGIDVNVIPYP